MSNMNLNWPEFSFPAAEASVLLGIYESGSIILEYGSGGSTVAAAKMPGKLIFSVESDRIWALRLQSLVDASDFPSPATLYHSDIGETGEWGRPVSDSNWPFFHKYPLDIWSEPFFRDPDVVLIDGRFRAACMMAVLATTKKDVTVIFDDYVDRRPYHLVEEVISPIERIGRIAIFQVKPGLVSTADLRTISRAFSLATYDGDPTYYSEVADAAVSLRRDLQKRHHR